MLFANIETVNLMIVKKHPILFYFSVVNLQTLVTYKK